MNARVLLTGATGYLGPYVAERLRDRWSLTLSARSQPEIARRELSFIAADVTDLDAMTRACAGQDAVIHMAATRADRLQQKPTPLADVVVKGTWHILEACVRQGVRRLVNVSSILACGRPVDNGKAFRAGDPSRFLRKDLSYPLAKRLAEQVADAYRDAWGIEVIHLRPGVIAGDPRNLPPDSASAKTPYWFRHVDPRDVAQSIERALLSDVMAGVYHIVAGRPDSLFDWTEARDAIGYAPRHNWPEIPYFGGQA